LWVLVLPKMNAPVLPALLYSESEQSAWFAGKLKE
jgi:hypothetical protein